MITKIEEWCVGVCEARWFQCVLVPSVIYAAAWWFFLPTGAVFDAVVYAVLGVWAGMLLMMIGALVLAVGQTIKEHFLPWDGQERRWRERGPAVGIGRAVGKS